MRLAYVFMADKEATGRRVRRLPADGGAWVVTTPLAERLSAERRPIGLTHQEVAELVQDWGRGCWYDLGPGGLRVFVLRAEDTAAGS